MFEGVATLISSSGPRPARVEILCALVAFVLISLKAVPSLAEPGSQVTGPQVTGPSEALETATLPRTEPRDPSQKSAKKLPKRRFDTESTERAQVVDEILAAMTLQEKIGQLCQSFPGGDSLSDDLAGQIRAGQVGSIFFAGNEGVIREAQRVAVEESRLGVPLVVARDVIHGFRTVFPIPLGQAASWNPELVEQAAKIAADEARLVGIHWTFAPMIDISRDPRWGRIAESAGEDPVLTSALGAAMVRGFQSTDANGGIQGVASCPKHFVAYGLSEGGRDYNRAMVSRNELRNVYLPPFKACIDEGALTLMTGFNTLNGIPVTGHKYLLRDILKKEWEFSGLVVSDWGSVFEMIAHGSVANTREAAELAMHAGVDMEMVSTCYWDRLAGLVSSGRVDEKLIDDSVRRILDTKIQLGLFDQPYADKQREELLAASSLQTARQLARESMVLLKNDAVLPLEKAELKKVAVIGPFAEAPQDQLGTWTMDGKASDSVTPLAALKQELGDDCEVIHVPCLNSISRDTHEGFEAAVAAAQEADVVLLFVGEEEAFSGEAHSRSRLGLPGSQSRLVRLISNIDKPIVMVVNAGRPLTIGAEVELVDAVLYGWQAGTMMGPAVVDLLLGVDSPSGKLPVTFPKSVGQVPLYYNHPNTGRPSSATYKPVPLQQVKDLPENVRYKSHYIDSDPFPLFPFGFGLSYTKFRYDDLRLSTRQVATDGSLTVSVRVTNIGEVESAEVVQLYVRDLVGSVVRPVKELKAFRKIRLEPGQSKEVEFELLSAELGFYNEQEQFLIEPGDFQLWVGGDSTAELSARFTLE